MDDEELNSPLKEVADKHCPGFDYFLEVDVVKEVLEDLEITDGNKSLEQRIDRVI